jgi:hypothetical protein
LELARGSSARYGHGTSSTQQRAATARSWRCIRQRSAAFRRCRRHVELSSWWQEELWPGRRLWRLSAYVHMCIVNTAHPLLHPPATRELQHHHHRSAMKTHFGADGLPPHNRHDSIIPGSSTVPIHDRIRKPSSVDNVGRNQQVMAAKSLCGRIRIDWGGKMRLRERVHIGA